MSEAIEKTTPDRVSGATNLAWHIAVEGHSEEG